MVKRSIKLRPVVSRKSKKNLKFNSIKSKLLKQSRLRKKINSNQKFKKFKEELKLFKNNLNRIKKETYKLHNINKTQLNNTWAKGLKNFRQGNYGRASKYFLMCFLIGTILLDRMGSYKTAYKTSGELVPVKIGKNVEKNTHQFMCGLLYHYDIPQKNAVFNHKVTTKGMVNKIIGPAQYFKNLKKSIKEEKIISDGFDDSSLEKVFDFVYTCRNPHIRSAPKLIHNAYTISKKHNISSATKLIHDTFTLSKKHM